MTQYIYAVCMFWSIPDVHPYMMIAQVDIIITYNAFILKYQTL